MKDRLISLDALRGFTIALMIIVNDPGSWDNTFGPLLHAKWNGITLTDVVFPFFIFIVGVSIVLSQKNKGTSSSSLKIFVRSIKIFTLGIFLSVIGGFLSYIVGSGELISLSDVRIPGVLQRIALVYLACAILYNKTNWMQQFFILIGIVVVYYVLMLYVPVPGVGAGFLEPGKNLAAYIDSLLIPGTLWQGTWDPEGLLSTLPAIATGISGMLAGHLIISSISLEKKVIWMFCIGVFCLLDSFAWELLFPINKNLWTSTYVMYTSGWAYLLFACLMWYADVLNYRMGIKFGIIFGSNSIAIYALSQILVWFFYDATILGDSSINDIIYGGMVNIGIYAKTASLIWAILYMLMCYVPAYYLYKKKIFIKL